MKILFLYRSCGPSFVARGWEAVLRACGHEVSYWDGRGAFDAFRSFKPDLFVGTTWDADEALLKLCREFPLMRVALYAATWGDLADGMDPVEYPIVRVTDREKALLERMRRETGRPDLVWLHLTPSWVEPVLGGYRSVGVEPAGVTNAADLYAYHGGEFREEYACDVAFIGGCWDYKGKVLQPYLGPLLHPDHPAKLHCKVFGWSGWPQHNYLGTVEEPEAKHVFRSAKVCPSVGEPHSLVFSDIVERHYKCVASGGVVVGGPEVGLVEEFGYGTFPAGSTPEHFQDLVVHFVNNADAREAVRRRQYGEVVTRHTYFERVAQLWDLLGLPVEAEKTRRQKELDFPSVGNTI